METLSRWIGGVNDVLWTYVLVAALLGCAVWFTLRTRGVQFRLLGEMMRVLGESAGSGPKGERHVSSFQAFAVSLASRVGTGNLAGVATAIVVGGPGAVFWMWISAILGMCTKFSEVTLAVHFREKNADGDLVGGPMYYIKNGLKKQWHWLAYLFAAFGVLTVFGTGNATQVNTITTAIDSALYNYGVISEQNVSTLNLVIGIILAVLIGLILLGGIKRIGKSWFRLWRSFILFLQSEL